METEGKTLSERLEVAAFKSHLWRVPSEEKGGRKYKYMIKYILAEGGKPLEDNFLPAVHRLENLRKAFRKLEPSAQEEFTQRLTQGLNKKYWEIVGEKEATEMRKKILPGHYLPSNFVLKTQGTTRARLVLDPSGTLNQSLLKAPNLEENISSVMRRIQGTPVLCSLDI